MNYRESEPIDQTLELIYEFNQEVKSGNVYYMRKRVHTTRTIFFDNEHESPIPFRGSAYGWCTISSEMAELLQTSRSDAQVISFGAEEEKTAMTEEDSAAEFTTSMKEHIASLSRIYLDMHRRLTGTYRPDASARVEERLTSLKVALDEERLDILNLDSVIDYLKKEIKIAKSGKKPKSPPLTYEQKRAKLIQKVIQLRGEGIHSVKDICTLCDISVRTYYTLCRREDRHEWPYIRPRGRQFNENSLRPPEKECIKYMADLPQRSYTVPKMCIELSQRFNRPISYKKVYTYLTKVLQYSYKRNRYKGKAACESGQPIVKHKVCMALLGFMQHGKNIIYLDESGFGLDTHAEYGYARRGMRSFRVGNLKSQRLNLIMAITNKNVFAYQIRKGSHNEHSFISFILGITRKLYEVDSHQISNTVLFLDNARFHRSTLAMKLLRLLPFTTIFNAPFWSELNPIEMVFGIIKRRIKAIQYMNM